MKTQIYIIILLLSFHPLKVYSQTENIFNSLYQYYLIQSEFKNSVNDLNGINLNNVNEKLNRIQRILNDTTSFKQDISLIDEVNGFRFYSLLHPINSEYASYTLFAINDDVTMEITTQNVLDFINKYLIQYSEKIGKERIIDLYEKLKFYHQSINFYNYQLHTELDSLTYGDLNRFIEHSTYTSLTKLFDLQKNRPIIETYTIRYKFYWNKLDIELELLTKNYK